MGKSFGAEGRYPQIGERVLTPDGRVGYVKRGRPESQIVNGRYLFDVHETIERAGGTDSPAGNWLGQYTAFELKPA